MATNPYASKDRLHALNEPSRWEMVAKQKAAEELQCPRAGAASSSNVPQTFLQQANMEVILQYADKHRTRNLDEGQTSSVRHGIIMEKLVKYSKLTKVCLEGIRKMCSPKFNNEQCGYLVEKLEATFESARLFIEEYQAQSIEMVSILDRERWVETFKLLLVLGKQVEGFVQDCGKDEWIQVARTSTNVGEYVSSIGFNLELCKVALCKWEGVAKCYTLEEVVKLNADEVESVKKKALDDVDTLLKKVTEVLNTLNAQDVELVTYLKLKLAGDMGNPSFVEENSNVLVKLFNWVKNMGERVEQIGRGASARVYKVMWFGIPVAKKTFDGPENQEFLQEVKVLSQLHHPNITSMFCCNMKRRECSIIMELMDGSLYDFLRSRQGEDDKFFPFSDVEGLNLMLQIGEGVEYLHHKQIVHRDLKSANILVKRLEALNLEVVYMQLKVVDFGLSKTKETSTSLSPMTYNVGSSRWMAPEVIKFNEVNQEVLQSSEKLPKYNFKGDIYSFGMVCYEILVGEIPFQSEGLDRNVKKMVLRGLRPSLPEYCPLRLAKLIQQCWSHDPKERPSIGDICAELKYLTYLTLMRTRDKNVQIEAIDDQEEQADAWARVSDDSINSIPTHHFEDFKNDEISSEGSQTTIHIESEVNESGNSKVVRSPSQLPSLQENTASPNFEGNDPLPGIEGFRILGDFVLGSRCTASGHPVNGTHLCIFQWYRYLKDGTAMLIEGANQPDYVITADDIGKKVAVECVPLDKRARRGEMVKALVEASSKEIVAATTDPTPPAMISTTITNSSPRLSRSARLIPSSLLKMLAKKLPLNAFPWMNVSRSAIVGVVKEYTLKEVLKMTDNFRCELGYSCEDVVYFGTSLRDEPISRKLGIKKIRKIQTYNNEKEFWVELNTISRLHHRNLVALLGFCAEGDEFFLVYEHMAKARLDQLLHSLNLEGAPVFNWKARMRCAAEVAQGLEYLHSQAELLHLGVSPGNIYFDEDMQAKIADFGMIEPLPKGHQPTVSTAVRGMFGYVDPVFMNSGVPCDKTDVYSYGVVLLELITGRRAFQEVMFLPGWCKDYFLGDEIAMRHKVPTMVDKRINRNEISDDQLYDIVKVAQMCVEDRQEDRPSMREVVVRLHNANCKECSSSGTSSLETTLDSTVSQGSNFSSFTDRLQHHPQPSAPSLHLQPHRLPPVSTRAISGLPSYEVREG